MPIGPNLALTIAVAGMLAIYCEFIWPGRVFPGVLGSVSVIVGGYFLSRYGPSLPGLLLLGSSALLFVADALLETRSILGFAGTALLFAGFLGLLPNPHQISAPLAVFLAVLLGTSTTFLTLSARRARRNKRADLDL